ncbi:hypothetical protein GDO86_019239 [Hymenochirus boettgeri]|uniref:T-box domain-containing protein n=1 Tax=Hymenochirus boettgeri TaxID=247094 RepID=A0A8T2IH76_9PIPI|nr:hypothetical protein GDO86_019239 [Hymenochirus boettgeri]
MGGPYHQSVGYYLPSHCCPPTGPPHSPVQVSAQLENRELWERFNSVGTEMILTKSGRRMFPEFSVSLSGLDPHLHYTLCVQALPEGDARYKWRNGTWSKSGRVEPGPPTRLYMHPESPAPGHRWMDRPISFSKIRLTNNTLSQGGQIVLQSMHRYCLRLFVIPTTSQRSHSGGVMSFTFPETSFIAVTSYQNPKLSLLKIEENPFAKGIKFFKSQQESLSPQKRFCSSDLSENKSSGIKKCKESADNGDLEENGAERQEVPEERAGEDERTLHPTDERRDVKDNVKRGSKETPGDVTEEGKQQVLKVSLSPTVMHHGSTTQRLSWPSPPGVHHGPVMNYIPSPNLTGYRFASHHHHLNVSPLHAMTSRETLDSSFPNVLVNPWTLGAFPQGHCFSELHHPFFQQKYPPPLFVAPPTTFLP